MKTLDQFQEAVSAARLAQLAAKGKGAAADAKMKADKLSPEKRSAATNRAVDKVRRLPGSKGGSYSVVDKPKALPGDKGGALATRPKSSLATRPADKGSSIVRTKATNKNTDTTGFKRKSKPNKGYMSTPDTRIEKPRTLTEPTGGDLKKKKKEKKKKGIGLSNPLKNPFKRGNEVGFSQGETGDNIKRRDTQI